MRIHPQFIFLNTDLIIWYSNLKALFIPNSSNGNGLNAFYLFVRPNKQFISKKSSRLIDWCTHLIKKLQVILRDPYILMFATNLLKLKVLLFGWLFSGYFCRCIRSATEKFRLDEMKHATMNNYSLLQSKLHNKLMC